MGERLREVPNWEKDLAPRLILGLWLVGVCVLCERGVVADEKTLTSTRHPSFLEPAKRLIPGATVRCPA